MKTEIKQLTPNKQNTDDTDDAHCNQVSSAQREPYGAVCKGHGLIVYTQSTHITPTLPSDQWPGILAAKQVCLTSSPLSMCWVNPGALFVGWEEHPSSP